MFTELQGSFNLVKQAWAEATYDFIHAIGAAMNARAAEFIAKPGRSEELREHICKAVTQFLGERGEFSRTIVLSSDEEPRRVVAISFWSLEEHNCTPWEDSPVVREILSPLVDVWPRGRTYKVDLTERTEADEQAMRLTAETIAKYSDEGRVPAASASGLLSPTGDGWLLLRGGIPGTGVTGHVENRTHLAANPTYRELAPIPAR